VLESVDSIKNVGLFDDHTQAPGTEFTELTLIFGENGVGKTTVAAILDSLRERNPVTITRRRTLWGQDGPACAVRLDGERYTFDGSDWDSQPPHGTIEVFFPDFVTRNVYAGGGVESDHRRNLCEFVLGRQAVQDVERLADADDRARAAQKLASQLDDHLKKIAKPPDTLETLINLPKDAEIETQLAQARDRLAAAKASDEILKRPVPSQVAPPVLDKPRVQALLSASDVDVAADVGKVVREHVAAHLDADGEDWLKYGAAHGADDKCPFCGQDVQGVDLVEAIGAYFSAEYRAFVERIGAESADILSTCASSALAPVRVALAAQIAVAGQWNAQHPLDAAALERALETAGQSWQRGASLLEALLTRKQASPLEAIPADETITAFDAYEQAVAGLALVNGSLKACADKAEEYRKVVAGASIADLANALARLENQKTRHEAHAVDLVAQRAAALQQRKEADADKERLKTAIDEHASKVVGKYQDGINHYLAYFGCELRIDKVEAKFPAGKASVGYKLVVRGYEVPLGHVEEDPCFETVLSEGDKSSLALAFFLARLKDMPVLTGKVIVLDDPVNSLGGSRRRMVEAVIRDLRGRGAQVVVLTHDERLAAMMWRDSMKIGAMKKIVPLQVKRSGNGSSLLVWDAEGATRSEYVNDYLTLVDYLAGNGDEKRAAGCIRPYVEQRLRHIYPGLPFTTRDPLGEMIKKIRGSGPGDRLEQLKSKLPDLEAINDASLPAHHATDDVPGMPPLTPSEVRVYAQKALEVLG
jgi:wobble nucleotide-excising tRNase